MNTIGLTNNPKYKPHTRREISLSCVFGIMTKIEALQEHGRPTLLKPLFR